ncbi:carbohydrate kinase [Kriegella sp. EG-1]|nr:carbohydrate kinase [Flavobacteriaceae bacterium EG-1]
MKTKVTAVFDIGKTNKKFFLFDSDLQEVYREYVRFDEITDENGCPTENLEAIENWSKEVFNRMINASEFDIVALNFSCYGASLVHIDENGKPLTPLYNYLKPLEEDIYNSFYATYGPENEISRITGSPRLGMLNSGMQLFWLKYTKPEIFRKIKYSLHLPQYLSYLFTGIPVSEYTSIGCHTLLWDYEKKDYHNWVYQEKIDKKLPSIVASRETTPINYNGKTIQIGPGVHDSSSALLPYIRSITKPFLLVSTGTWSISINPFNKNMLTSNDIQNDGLFNMRIDGSPVKVSRLFLGNEYKIQIQILAQHFKVPEDYHKTVSFNQNTFFEIKKDFVPMFKWSSITTKDMPEETKLTYDKFEHAYHQLMLELVLLQVKSIKAAIGNEKIDRLYIDGGFSDNEVYIQLLSQHLYNMKLRTTDSSLGSALGAALVISDITLEPKFLKKNYSLKKHRPSKSK